MNDPVILSIPADSSYVALARSVSASMSARADLPIDQLEDVRLAVDEAVSQLMAHAPGGAHITCAFAVDGPVLDMTLSAPSTSAQLPSTTTFSWTVMQALVDDVDASLHEGSLVLHLRVTRNVAVEA